MKLSIALFASAVAAAATPQIITAKYDDITVVPAVPAANVISTYKGLKYQGFAVNAGGVGGAASLTGVKAQSLPNSLVSGIQQTAVNGVQAGFQATGQTKSFDLDSLFFGCSVNTSEGAEGLAQQCTILIRGYRNIADTHPVGQRKFTFDPALTTPLANMNQAVFLNLFKNIKRVQITQLESTSGEALNVVLVDNIKYKLNK